MRVLVAGAGIAGPCFAWHLTRSVPNAVITVVERAPKMLDQGQNIDVHGSALEIIKRMCLLDELKRWNTGEQGTRFIGPSGKPYATFPLGDGSGPSATSEFEILRGDLARILYEASRADSNTTYKFGATVEQVISYDLDKPARVTLSTGETHDFDLIVAADGQWSNMRKKTFAAEDVLVIDKGMYVAYFTIPRNETDVDQWDIYHALGSRVVSTRPDPHGTIRAMLSYMPTTDAQKEEWQQASRGSREQQQDLTRRYFRDAGWQSERLLAHMPGAPDFYFQAVQQIKLRRWSSGRVVALGDAAHAPTPLTGMGTSLAILGSYILAGELGQLTDPANDPNKAFEAYEAKLRPFVENVQDIPWFIPGVAHPGSTLKRALLQAGIWALSMFVRLPYIRTSNKEGTGEDFKLPNYDKHDEKRSQ